MKFNSASRKEWILIAVVAVVCVIVNMISISHINGMDKRVTVIEQQLEGQQTNQEEVLGHLKDIKAQQEKIQELERTRLEIERKHQAAVENMTSRGFNRNTDIGANIDLTIADMDKIIDQVSAGRHTRFQGKGYAFIEASKETGLNPVYLLAHAALESDWGNSNIAVSRNNFYGINAVDTNPNRATAMGDDIDAGIINGAKWIKRNFYDNGYTTLDEMKAGNYATSSQWESNIEKIANECINYL
jgi:beta-N-acetylglucosaminidase